MNYKPMTPLQHERERVNIAQHMQSDPCLAVSLEFFDEMLCCVPPAYFGTIDAAGFYSMMQVGEASSHNARGQETYETFQRMNQAAVDGKLADSRMTVGQWYFVGQQPLFIKK
jgi:hypothetical protein